MTVCVLGTIIIFGKKIHEYGLEKERFQDNDGKCLLNCPVQVTNMTACGN